MSTAKKILLWALGVIAMLMVLGMVFALVCVLKAPRLDLTEVSPNTYYTTVVDDAGQEIHKLQGEEANRVYVTLDQIPDTLEQAVIAIEDERFYKHNGVDLVGILRAVGHDLTTFSLSQGASTITQQLVKNSLLDGWTQEQNIFQKLQRKIQEQYLAVRLEHKVTKQWILENYLNTINMGSGTWGVETASQCYFGKSVSEISLSESAVLAAIIQSPSYNNPYNYPDSNRSRREAVLNNMKDQGYITDAQLQEALADDVYTRISQNYTAAEAEPLSYFEDALVNQVISDLVEYLGYSQQDAWTYLYRGGLTVVSTQNSQMQTIAEEEVNNSGYYPAADVQSAVVVMEPSTGQVKAIVGGRGEKSASLVMNRATSSLRQPGSTIKVIGEYSAALDTGVATLATVYDNAPSTYSNGTSLKNADGSYTGLTTVRDAIIKSINIVAVKCIQQVGVDTTWNYLKNYGLDHLTEEDKVEALALGGIAGGVTPLEMTAAYNAIANGGTYIEPTFYSRILDRNGNVILEAHQTSRQVIKQSTAELLRSAMEDVMTSGTGTPAAFSGTDLAGKSGTTDDARDLWFVGFSPKLTCGVWGGYDSNAAQSSTGYVKSIWRGVMSRGAGLYGASSFDEPTDLIRATICTKCGNLAVSGLCSDTVQGDMTRTEYFASTNQPTKNCTCHVKVSVCSASGQLAGDYCPSNLVTENVYLKTGTAGTPDASAVAPSTSGTTCTVHTSIWDTFFKRDEDEDYDDEDGWGTGTSPSPSGNPYYNGGADDFFGGGGGGSGWGLWP